jgi:hypothetical protein
LLFRHIGVMLRYSSAAAAYVRLKYMRVRGLRRASPDADLTKKRAPALSGAAHKPAFRPRFPHLTPI